jgi:membrane-associated protease RseP (regulator of RpoE activity)
VQEPFDDGPSLPSDAYVPVFVPPPLPPPPKDRVWIHWVLLAITLATTTIAGGCHYASFQTDLATAGDPDIQSALGLGDAAFYFHGLWYSLTILTILGCHEMGHYLMALRYGVEVSRPYFLPAPLPLTGTLGAFIRIRSRIPTKVALFDIGIAGPLAGFVVAVPALVIGLGLSRVDQLPVDQSSLIELGEPLLFKLAAWLVWGPVAEGSSINMHPMAFASWFGLLMTALNLFPIAQLDGGHISYAVLGPRSTIVTLMMMGVAVGLTFVSSSWMAWTVMMVVMLVTIGARHPRVLDEDVPLDRGRLILAALAMLILIVCFTPAPIGPFLGTE